MERVHLQLTRWLLASKIDVNWSAKGNGKYHGHVYMSEDQHCEMHKTGVNMNVKECTHATTDGAT